MNHQTDQSHRITPLITIGTVQCSGTSLTSFARVAAELPLLPVLEHADIGHAPVIRHRNATITTLMRACTYMIFPHLKRNPELAR